MLHGFLAGLSAHLRPGGEGRLILSELAEHLGLRSRGDLLDAIGSARLRVLDTIDTKPRHPRSKDAADPAGREELHQGRQECLGWSQAYTHERNRRSNSTAAGLAVRLTARHFSHELQDVRSRPPPRNPRPHCRARLLPPHCAQPTAALLFDFA